MNVTDIRTVLYKFLTELFWQMNAGLYWVCVNEVVYLYGSCLVISWWLNSVMAIACAKYRLGPLLKASAYFLYCSIGLQRTVWHNCGEIELWMSQKSLICHVVHLSVERSPLTETHSLIGDHRMLFQSGESFVYSWYPTILCLRTTQRENGTMKTWHKCLWSRGHATVVNTKLN